MTFSGAGSLTNSAGGVIGGDGVLDVNGTLVNDGTLTAGNSPGSLVLSDTDVASSDTSVLLFEIAGAGGLANQGLTYDFLEVGGEFGVDGTLTVHLLDGFTPASDDVYTVLEAQSILGAADDFANVVGGVLTSGDLTAMVQVLDGNTLVLSNLSVAPIPIPGALPLFASAGLILGWFGWHRRRGHIT